MKWIRWFLSVMPLKNLIKDECILKKRRSTKSGGQKILKKLKAP
jgi:hypothetical protein